MSLVLATIATANLDAADVAFLVAFILFVVAFVTSLVPGAAKLVLPAVTAGLALVAFALLVL